MAWQMETPVEVCAARRRRIEVVTRDNMSRLLERMTNRKSAGGRDFFR